MLRKKKTNKEIIVEDDNEEEEIECEKLEINNTALIELCYYYDNSDLSLRDCILAFNNQINDALKPKFKFDFITLLKNPEVFNNVQKILDNTIEKSKIFFF